MSKKILPDNIKEEIKKMGYNPDEMELFDDINPEMFDKMVIVTGIIDCYAIRLSPPIKITYNGKIRNIKFEFDGNTFSLETNSLLKLVKKGSKENNIDIFNKFITYLNIVGIPLDFISGYDLIIMLKLKSSLIETNLSNQSRIRGKGIKETEIDYERFDEIIEYANYINHKISNHELYKDSKIWTFYGRGYYYGFHADAFNTFIYFWMFIEASLHWNWRISTKNAYNSFIPNENTPLVKKIDDLFLLKKLGEKGRNTINELRNRRNNIFHINPDPEKREITEKEILNVIKIAETIFYKTLDVKYEKSLKLNEIRMEMHKYMHKHPDPDPK